MTAFALHRRMEFRRRSSNRTAARLTRQIVLDLPAKPPRMTRAAYVLSASNEAALKTLDAWRASGEFALAISGPEGSGKTHLLNILKSECGWDVSVIDDADAAGGAHLLLAEFERARETGSRIAIAGRGDPAEWAAGLIDLRTRLAAAPRIALAEPDEELLRAVMTKMFADRQLRAPEQIAGYAAPRIEKTFAAAERFVAALDALSIEKGAGISVKLAREALANLSEDGL